MIKPPESKLKYRADIDGLRAVAVLLVVFSHLKFHRLEGGFVGVDIFFVISGFLISAIIMSQILGGNFSIVSFYERRIRRIFPALMVMLFVTTVLAFIYFLPPELVDYCRSLLAATFSGSNIYFWQKANYFDAPAAVKPLLHTWSLGVEEQFYIFFPLVLILVKKLFPNRMRTAIVTLAILSFVVSVISLRPSPQGTFYLAHTRAWELLIGTILSMKMLPQLTNRFWREAASGLGLAMIAFAALYYGKATPFPGATALVPCLGAGLIIAAGQGGESLVGKLLSLKPVVFVGLISYSLYLWHWPIIVFQSIGGMLGGNLPATYSRPIALVASLLAGYLSYRFIEVPFRSGGLKVSGPVLFKGTAVAVAFITVLGLTGIFDHGFPSRFTPDENRLASYLAYEPQFREGSCFITPRETFADFDRSTCLHQDAARKNYLILGDSHAAQLWYGLSHTFPDTNIMQATATGCRPVPDSTGDPQCVKMMQYMYSNYLVNNHIDKLVLACFWGPNDVPVISKILAWAKQRGIEVVLFGPIIVYETELPRLLVESIVKKDAGYPDQRLLPGVDKLDRGMAEVARQYGVEYISYFDMLCKEKPCVEYADGKVPLQFDVSHLTSEGSVLVSERLRSAALFP